MLTIGTDPYRTGCSKRCKCKADIGSSSIACFHESLCFCGIFRNLLGRLQFIGFLLINSNLQVADNLVKLDLILIKGFALIVLVVGNCFLKSVDERLHVGRFTLLMQCGDLRGLGRSIGFKIGLVGSKLVSRFLAFNFIV